MFQHTLPTSSQESHFYNKTQKEHCQQSC